LDEENGAVKEARLSRVFGSVLSKEESLKYSPLPLVLNQDIEEAKYMLKKLSGYIN
jgi:hypothetical protein